MREALHIHCRTRAVACSLPAVEGPSGTVTLQASRVSPGRRVPGAPTSGGTVIGKPGEVPHGLVRHNNGGVVHAVFCHEPVEPRGVADAQSNAAVRSRTTKLCG